MIRSVGEATGSFSFDTVGTAGQQSWEAGLFPQRDGDAGTTGTNVSGHRENSSHAPTWRAMAHERRMNERHLLAACSGPTYYGAVPPMAGTMAPIGGELEAQTGGFSLQTTRRNVGGSSSMPDLGLQPLADGAAIGLQRSSKSTWDMAMDCVFDEEEVRESSRFAHPKFCARGRG